MNFQLALLLHHLGHLFEFVADTFLSATQSRISGYCQKLTLFYLKGSTNSSESSFFYSTENVITVRPI
jgi:hypothetical protein